MLIFYKNKLNTSQHHVTSVTEVNKALKMVQLITVTAESETMDETTGTYSQWLTVNTNYIPGQH